MKAVSKFLGLAVVLLAAAALLTAAPAHAAAANPKPIIDFNSDNRADIAMIDGDHLYFRHGRSDGTFSLPYYIGSGWLYFSNLIAPGDINSDGHDDLMAIYNQDTCLYKWYGRGNNTFSSRIRIGCGWTNYHGLTGAGDLNGDGKPDIVAVNLGEHTGCLHRWYGDGRGGFGVNVKLGCGWQPYVYLLIGPGDGNRDGKADLVAINWDTRCAYLWPGNGAGGFGSARLSKCIDDSRTDDLTAPGDVNGDGWPEIFRIKNNECLMRSSYPYFQLERQVGTTCYWDAISLAH